MMLIDAYRAIKEKIKEPFNLRQIREYKKYFVFILSPADAKNGDRVFIGGEAVCIDKNDGKVYFSDSFRHEKPVRIVNDTILQKLIREDYI